METPETPAVEMTTIYTLWLKERGEDLPEMFLAVDEYTDESNPDYWNDNFREIIQSYAGSMEAFTRLPIAVPRHLIEEFIASPNDVRKTIDSPIQGEISSIKTLWIQRKDPCAGEEAPEMIFAVDDRTEDINPDYWKEKAPQALEACGDEVENYAVIWIDIPGKVIDDALFPPETQGYVITNDALVANDEEE